MEQRSVAQVLAAVGLAFIAAYSATISAAAQSRLAATDPQDDLVVSFLREFFADSGFSGDPQTRIQFADLNGDAQDDALVVLDEPLYCGARGCSAFVLVRTEDGMRPAGDFIAVSLTVLPSRTGGWQDLSVGGIMHLYHQDRYVPSWEARGDGLVMHVQRMLRAAGHEPGPVDGVMGRRTRSALNNYQAANGLAIRDEIDRQTLVSLDRFARRDGPMGPGNERSDPPPRSATERSPSESPSRSGDLRDLAERTSDLSCEARPPSDQFASPTLIETRSTSEMEGYSFYSDQPELIAVGRTKDVRVIAGGAGDDTFYIDAVEAGTSVNGEVGADTFLVCALGDLALALDVGPADTRSDVVVIDRSAIENAPTGAPAISIMGFVPTNDRLIVRAPNGARVNVTDSKVVVGDVHINVHQAATWGAYPPRAGHLQSAVIVQKVDGAIASEARSQTNGGATNTKPIATVSDTPKTLSGSAIEIGDVFAACRPDIARIATSPVPQSPEESWGGRTVSFTEHDDLIVFEGGANHQYVFAERGADHVGLFALAPGTMVYGGTGADVIALCEMGSDQVSASISLGPGAGAADADRDVLALAADAFTAPAPGFTRVLNVHDFGPKTDRLVLALPTGTGVTYREMGGGGAVVGAANVTIKVFPTARGSIRDAIILVPPDYVPAGPAVPQIDEPTDRGRWTHTSASTYAGQPVNFVPPDPDCADLKTIPSERWAATSNAPDRPYGYWIQAYTQSDDLILLDALESVQAIAGQGDDRIYLRDVGDGVHVQGNGGRDTIVVCSMRGATLSLAPGTGMIDASPDTIVIDAPVFEAVPEGIEREIVIDGFNVVNDQLVLRIPEDLDPGVPPARGDGGTIRIGSVVIRVAARSPVGDIAPNANAFVQVGARRDTP